MRIRCWGSRGSIPVSGKNYNKYGGDTTCLEIRTKSDDIVIVDAGTGIRRLGNFLINENRFRYHFIFTHAHWDHLMGFPFFKPLFLTQTELIMHRCPFDSEFVATILNKIMSPPYFPLQLKDVEASIRYLKACPQSFAIGSMTVTPIPLSHPNAGSGYKFEEDGKTFIFLTDNELGYVHPQGLAYADYCRQVKGADLLIHDAEYTPDEYQETREWGHSCYTDTNRLALEAGVKRLGLFHLNQDRSDSEVDEIVLQCQKAGKGGNLDVFAVGSDMVFDL
jgi:phosphoribosyl 1,2-cyclic phosphodiesterase